MTNGATTPIITRKPGTIKPPVTQQQWQTWLRNRQQASDRGNWSDGGHWIGLGPEPNAFDTLTAESSSTVIFEWPSNECVDKFRQQSATIAQRLGYGWGALTGFLLRNHWVVGIAAGIVTSWLLGQEGIRVHRGWSYSLENTIAITLSAHPWGKKELKTESIQKLYDENKKLVDQKTLTNTRDLRDLPEASLWQLIQAVGNKSGEITTITCPDASVLMHT